MPADWQDHQTENVAAHLAQAKAMVASNVLDPILFSPPGSRPGTPGSSTAAPPGSTSAGEIDYQNYSHRRPQLSNDSYRPPSAAASRHSRGHHHQDAISPDYHNDNYLLRPGSAALSSSPLASEIASHPLRPPSQTGSAAQWTPRPGTPGSSVITTRPTTAPTGPAAAGTSSSVQSWGFALPPPAAAASASRPGTAAGGRVQSPLGTNRQRPQSHRDLHAANRPGSSRLTRIASGHQEVKPGIDRRALQRFLA